jgi:hypothetical protein
MAPGARANIERRDDMSHFLVHLTRDDSDTFTNGDTASINFISILKSRTIHANSPHCLHNSVIKQLPSIKRKHFKVICFTETPLNQLHHLVGEIPGRQIKLEPYGFVFKKELLVSYGAQPAIYINSYKDNWLKEAASTLLENARLNETKWSPLWRFLPFINAMHAGYDFSWEREWRLKDDFKFKLKDIVCVILPPTGEENIRQQLSEAGIAVISPGLSFQQIVAELAKQQKQTRKLALDSFNAVSSKVERAV